MAYYLILYKKDRNFFKKQTGNKVHASKLKYALLILYHKNEKSVKRTHPDAASYFGRLLYN